MHSAAAAGQGSRRPMERAQGTRCSLGQTAGVLPPFTESEPLRRVQGHSQETNLFRAAPKQGPQADHACRPAPRLPAFGSKQKWLTRAPWKSDVLCLRAFPSLLLKGGVLAREPGRSHQANNNKSEDGGRAQVTREPLRDDPIQRSRAQK